MPSGRCCSARAGVPGVFLLLDPGDRSATAGWELPRPYLCKGPWKAHGDVVLPHSPGQEVLAAAGEQRGHCRPAPADSSAAKPVPALLQISSARSARSPSFLLGVAK